MFAFFPALLILTSCASTFKTSDHNFRKSYTNEIIKKYGLTDSKPASKKETATSGQYTLLSDIVMRQSNPEILSDKAITKEERNVIVEDVMQLIDEGFIEFKTLLVEKRTHIDFFSDLFVLSANTASTLFTPVGTKTKISAISAGILGSKISYDENFFQGQGTFALIRKMEALRVEQELIIKERQLMDINDYPLGVAIRDLRIYYEAGTLIKAFEKVTEESGETEKNYKYYLDLIQGIDDFNKAREAVTNAKMLVAKAEITTASMVIETINKAEKEQKKRDSELNDKISEIKNKIKKMPDINIFDFAIKIEEIIPEEIKAFVNEIDPKGDRFNNYEKSRIVLAQIASKAIQTENDEKKWNALLEGYNILPTTEIFKKYLYSKEDIEHQINIKLKSGALYCEIESSENDWILTTYWNDIEVRRELEIILEKEFNNQKDAIMYAIKALSDGDVIDCATKVEKIIPAEITSFVEGIDPEELRHSNPEKSKIILVQIAEMAIMSEETLKQWQAVLKGYENQ